MLTLTNDNLGGYNASDLNYSIDDGGVTWLSVSSSGSPPLSPGDSHTITISYNTSTLTAGLYEAYITISDPNALNDPVQVNVRIEVIGIVTGTVSQSSDDACEVETDVHTSDPILYLGKMSTDWGGLRDSTTGIRFTNINIPANSKITEAYIEVQAESNYDGEAVFNIYGHKSGNPATFTTAQSDISNRPRTYNSATWEIVNKWNNNTIYATPDIKDIVQEIVNLPTWPEAGGSAMAFIITEQFGERPVFSFDGTGILPKLTIKYIPGDYPAIELDESYITNTIYEGDSIPNEIFTVTNSGKGTLNYTISDDADAGGIDWLNISPSSGNLNEGTGENITIDYSGVSSITYSGTPYTAVINVSDPNANNSPQTISSSLMVLERLPWLQISESYFGVTVYQGNDAFDQTVKISNYGVNDMTLSIDDDKSWLSHTDVSGVTIAPDGSYDITLSFQTAGLDPQIDTATITIHAYDASSGAEAHNSPLTVTVSLTVEEIPLSMACGDVPVYTENLVSPAIMVMLDHSGSMEAEITIEDEKKQSPDIKNIVQEIIDQSSWGEQTLAFIIPATASGHRQAFAYDSSGQSAAMLYVKYTFGGNTTEIEAIVEGNGNDAEERPNGTMTVNSAALDIAENTVGFRFTGLNIPQGSVIEEAYINFTPCETNDEVTTIELYGELAVDAVNYWDGADLTDRVRTTEYVSWTFDGWDAPTNQKKIDVAIDALTGLVNDTTISWGYSSWTGTYPSGIDYTKFHVGCKYSTIAHINNLKTAMLGQKPLGTTPFTPALRAGLDYFGGERADLTYNETYQDVECQPEFVIIITDGLGNTDTDYDPADGDPDNITPVLKVLADRGVNVVAIGFGMDDADLSQCELVAEYSNARGDEYDDDFLYALHDVEDGVPVPFLAKSKNALVDALNKITARIKAEVFHGSAPAPTTSVDYGDLVISAQFTAADWAGDLAALKYNVLAGELEESLWLASEQMPDDLSNLNAYTVLDGSSTTIVDYSGTTLPEICKPLGDIIDSTPIIVEDPPYIYNFDNYLSFKYSVNRDPMVYVGANDGALHAFLLSDKVESGVTTYGGTEMWRFYPYAIQDNLSKVGVVDHWNMCEPATYCHKYYVDGSPIVADIYDGSEWKSILVCGLRQGGEAYFALDITTGELDDTGDSEYLWEFTDAELGQTWGDVAIERVENDAGGTAWGIFFGSGYKEDPTDQANKEAFLYGIEANNKADLWMESGTTPINKIKISSTTLKDDVLAPPRVIDFEGDYKGDAIYAGNLYGNMYRVDNIGKEQEPTVSMLYDSGSTTHSSPVTTTCDYGYGESAGDVWIYFGTGIYEDQEDKFTTEQQYFFGLKDNISGTTAYTINDLNIMTADYYYYEIEDPTTGETEVYTYRTVEDNDTSDDLNESWAIKFGIPNKMIGSERVVSKPLIVGGIVFFTSFVPDVNVCAGSGDSYLYAVDYDTGEVPDDAVFDLNMDGVIDENDIIYDEEGNRVNIGGVYVGGGSPSEPVLHKDTMFVTTTGGGLVPKKVNLPDTRAALTSWEEM